jgi:hypothetical protein
MTILIAFVLCGKLECIPVTQVFRRPYLPDQATCTSYAMAIARSWTTTNRLLTVRDPVCMPAP